MQTSEMWWEAVKNDKEAFNEWLTKQWRGEVTASNRILSFMNQYATDERQIKVLTEIAKQESQHAEWVATLLVNRGIVVDPEFIQQAEKRYWNETLKGITSMETGAAVASHAERMRLERIRVISNDVDAPFDVREVFNRILIDEEWHEKAFANLSTDTAMTATLGNHEAGMEALGLTV
jgi:rubrerythrin